MKIIGIAAYAHSQYVPPLPCEPQCADTSFDNWHESLILYKPTDTGMVELASNTYNVRDTSRMMKLYSNMVYGVDSVTIGYYPIYEVYFDEPVIVTDSFYVAATNYNGVVDSQTMTYPGPLAHYAYYSPWASTTLCYPQYFKSRGSYTNYQWAHYYDDWILIIFPIIDTTQPRCWRPTGLSVQAQDSLAVYLAWDTATNNRTWEVAYGRADQDPEAYATLTTVSPECVLTSLDPAVEYAARVRALCYDNTMYSSWTDTVRFTRIGAPLTIDSPTAGRLRLIPNPAHNEITILSDTPVRHFAIYDMQGHTVMSAQVGIAGSTKVGEWCMFGGQVGIAGHATIADRTMAGAQAGIPNNIKKPGTAVQGTPAIDAKTFWKSSAVVPVGEYLRICFTQSLYSSYGRFCQYPFLRILFISSLEYS